MTVLPLPLREGVGGGDNEPPVVPSPYPFPYPSPLPQWEGRNATTSANPPHPTCRYATDLAHRYAGAMGLVLEILVVLVLILLNGLFS